MRAWGETADLGLDPQTLRTDETTPLPAVPPNEARACAIAEVWQDPEDPDNPLTVFWRTGSVVPGAAQFVLHWVQRLDAAASADRYRNLRPQVIRDQLANLHVFLAANEPREGPPGWSWPQDDGPAPPAGQALVPEADEGVWAAAQGDALPLLAGDPHMRTTFDHIGGRAAVEVVVERFYQLVLADPELRPYFDGYDVEEIKQHQRAFMTLVTGGPQAEYRGRRIRDAHKGVRVTSAHFDRAAEHLITALGGEGVDPVHRSAIIVRVAAFKPDVVAGTG